MDNPNLDIVRLISSGDKLDKRATRVARTRTFAISDLKLNDAIFFAVQF